MKRWVATGVLGSLFASAAISASPSDAWYAEDTDYLFWFLVIADVHTGENLWGGTQDTDNLAWVVGEAFHAIAPRFVFICGDLVDATHGGLIPKAQSDDEWSEYRSVLEAAGMTPDVLVDLPGNHDQYCDKGLTHYRTFSMQGAVDDQTQHSIIYWPHPPTPGRLPMAHPLTPAGPLAPEGFYHFLAVATPGNDGACWPADNAGLDAAEMDFIKAALAANAGAALHFAFGHHGVHWGGSNKVGEGGSAFRDLLKTHEVAAYFWGHTHDYLAEFHDGTLFFNVRSLGKNDDLNVALAAVDHDSLAVRAFTARRWPFVLVTAPADRSLGGGNPHAYTVPRSWASAPVRALVFSVPAPQGVRFRVDDGPWQGMAEVTPGVYQGAMDATGLAEGEHRLRVRADPWDDADHETRFLVGTTVCGNGQDDDGDGVTDFPDDPGCVNPADQDEQDPPPPPEPDPAADEAGADLDTRSDLAAEEVAVFEDASAGDPGDAAGLDDRVGEGPTDEVSFEEAVSGDRGSGVDAQDAAADPGGGPDGVDGDRVQDGPGRPAASVGGGCAHSRRGGSPLGACALFLWLVGALRFFPGRCASVRGGNRR